eukprot:jgi/Mesen1/2125/ME000152S01209
MLRASASSTAKAVRCLNRTASQCRVLAPASSALRGGVTASPSSTMQTVQCRNMASGPNHTAKWMASTTKMSPMELINAVPPIEVHGRSAACEGGRGSAVGHPLVYINLDAEEPAVCKYCGLRFVQKHDNHHH